MDNEGQIKSKQIFLSINLNVHFAKSNEWNKAFRNPLT